MNLANLLQRTARSHGERPAVCAGNDLVHDYAALQRRAAVLAGALRNGLALAEGERVALVLRNCPEYVELLFACWQAGLVAVPVNAKLHADEVAYVLEHSGARVCFASAGLEPSSAAGALREVVVPGGPAWRRLLQAAPLDLTPVAGEATAWLFYTSGTTGRPKGAMLTHANLMAMVMCYFSDVDAVSPFDAIVHAAPMSHGSGLYVLPHVARAACNVVPDSGGFEAGEIFALLARNRGATMFAAPTMVRRLVAAPDTVPGWEAGRDNLKTLVYGGGPMYLADLDAAHERLGYRLAQIYGQGESPMTITVLDKFQHADTAHPRHRARLASVGVASRLVEVRVCDDAGRPAAFGETGEVLVRGPSVVPGSWRDEAASAVALAGNWLHTGDLGHLDGDGFLTLVDRAKDLIISGGANIYPREVEEVLLRHPAVAEVAVVGRRDPEWGERVVAFGVVRDGDPAGDREATLAAQLDAWCLAGLARFKRPRDYRFVASLPKNNYGKVLKRELRAGE